MEIYSNVLNELQFSGRKVALADIVHEVKVHVSVTGECPWFIKYDLAVGVVEELS